MPVQLSNIINGIKQRLAPKKATSGFAQISWLQEKLLKHLEDKQVKTIRFGNLSFKYKRPYEILHTYKELFEDEIYRFQSLTPHPYIIDCGANIGMSVLYFKALYPQSHVLAFEPDEDNCVLLNENITLNNLTDVTVEQSAVWTKDETLYFSSAGSQASRLATEGEQTNVVEVKAVRLATVLSQQPTDLLKIDIEGAELDVMRDCATELKNVRNVFVEYHGKSGETKKLQELLSILDAAGFMVYIKMAADILKHPFVEKHTTGSFDVQLNIFAYR